MGATETEVELAAGILVGANRILHTEAGRVTRFGTNVPIAAESITADPKDGGAIPLMPQRRV